MQRRFVAWLRGRFGTLQRLNEALGLDYWSNRIGSWEDFPDVRGTINGSLACAFSEFQRELVTEFLAWQADIVRQYARPEQFLTHNFDFEWCGWSFGVQPDVAHNLAVRRLDLAGCDIYHPSQDDLTGREISFCGDLARCLKQAPYLVAETEAQGFPQWTPYPGQLRLQALMHLACGALGVMYWHWHSLHNGFETYWKGVMSHDMLPNPVYGEAKAVGAAFERLSDPLYGMRKPCRTAILVSNTALSAVERFRIPGGGPEGGLQYNDVVRWMYDACYDENLEMDVIFPDAEFSSYALLIAPCLYAADESLLARLRAYVEGGGHLVATFKLGFCDENVRVRPQPQPAGLRDVFGAGYSQFAAADGVYLDDGTAVSAWMELLTPEGADVLRRYDHPAWGGYAAVTRNRFGLGSAAYIGCMADGLYLRGLMREEAALAGIAPPDLRFPLIARSGWTDGRAVRFLLNFSGGERRIAWPFESCDDLLNGGGWEHGASVVLPPWGALIGKER